MIDWMIVQTESDMDFYSYIWEENVLVMMIGTLILTRFAR